jgi:hypothetical protein
MLDGCARLRPNKPSDMLLNMWKKVKWRWEAVLLKPGN